MQIACIFAANTATMKISRNWLNDYLNCNITDDQLSIVLTDNGLEVEGVESWEQIQGNLEGVFTGEVLECSTIEGSDHLHQTLVAVGTETFQIVCGAPNVAAGQKVLVALPGATLHFSDGKQITIKKAKIRGVESSGMICAEDELGLGTSHDGIMVLSSEISTGLPAASYLGLETDKIFEIGLTPNRSDAMCHTGVARDVYAAIRNRLAENATFTLPSVKEFVADHQSLTIPVSVQSPEACIRYSGLSLSGITVTESPTWLKNRLEAVGLRPINVVVDVTQYVMLELGQPLHAFDVDKISGGKVVVKMLPEGTSFMTLDGVERKLSGHDLMICDEQKGMCIAGVFGGAESGVTFDTTRVFLESACFSPVHVRKTARFHGLHTDASFRFERGTDPEATIYAIKRAALMLKELTGCQISSEISDFYPTAIQKPLVEISVPDFQSFAGETIPETTISAILSDLDFEVRPNGDTLVTRVPLNRTDVLRPVDVYEEVLRIYGYNRIPMPFKANTVYATSHGMNLHQLRQTISNHLSASGLNEIMCNSLVSRQWFEKAEILNIEDLVSLQNPLSRELNVMRPYMLPGILQSLAYNINRSTSDLRFYEFGKTYTALSSDKQLEVLKRFSEKNILALAVTGNERPENWKYKAEESGFFNMKALVEGIFHTLKIEHLTETNDEAHPLLSYGLQYIIKGKTLAFFGLAKPALSKLSDVDIPVWYAEIQLDTLLEHAAAVKVSYRDIPRFPTVRRDLSLLINKRISFSAIKGAAREADRKLLKEIDLFDVYIDKKLGEDLKSYAVSFRFRSDDKTLTDHEVDKAMERITAAILTKTGGSLR